MNTQQPFTLNFINPLSGDMQSFDANKPGHVQQFTALFPRAQYVVMPVVSENSKECDFEHGQKLAVVRKDVATIFKALTQGLDKAAKAALAQAKVDAIVAKMEVAMGEQDFEAIISLADERDKALIALAQAEKGKTPNGSGDRTNPLPSFETTNAIIRGKNGGKVFALRGDAIPDYEKHGLSANWQAFIADNGSYRWNGEIGQHTSWSSLNAAITKDVLNLDGKSIGTNGLEAVSATNLETIRKTMLIGLPDPTSRK